MRWPWVRHIVWAAWITVIPDPTRLHQGEGVHHEAWVLPLKDKPPNSQGLAFSQRMLEQSSSYGTRGISYWLLLHHLGFYCPSGNPFLKRRIISEHPLQGFTSNATPHNCNTTNLVAIGGSYCNLSIKWLQYVPIMQRTKCVTICVVCRCNRLVLLQPF
jgi:hypothetical protein